MTKEQITATLSMFSLSAGTWLPLRDIFPLISLSQDANIYPNDEHELYRFNNTQQLLEIVHGSYENTTFISNSGETSNYTPDNFIAYSLIAGFCRSVIQGPYGTCLGIN